MTLLLQQLFAGIAVGAIFGGLALALSVVFNGTGVLNFAQGELATFTTFLFWTFMQIGLSFWSALICVIPVAFIIGALIERILIRPVEDASELTIIIVTLALFLGINAISGLVWGFTAKSIDSPFGQGVFTINNAKITYQQFGMTLMMLLAAAVVGLFFRFTNLGLQLRAVAMNRNSSQYLGVNVSSMLMIGWGIAASTGAIAGVLIVSTTGLSPDMMSNALLIAVAALALGGSTSRAGALVGGIIVGVVTQLGITYVPFLSSDISDLIPFLIIVLILIVRPQGLFGRVSAVRS